MGQPESVSVPIKEGKYNHLYESDKEDMNESYDHAKSVPSSRAGKDGHGNLTSVGNNSREDNTECGKSMTATVIVPNKIQWDNYIIIGLQWQWNNALKLKENRLFFKRKITKADCFYNFAVLNFYEVQIKNIYKIQWHNFSSTPT